MVAINKKSFDKKFLFYILMLALPLLQFTVFYIYVNFNSFVLALKKYNPEEFKYYYVGLENFKDVINVVFVTEQANFAIRFQNSLFNYFMTLIVGMCGAIFFSYYIYKKKFCHGFFKIILFLPHIVPSVALISIFKYYVDSGVVRIINNIFGLEIATLLKDPRYNYATVLSFSLFMGFGVQVMMYLGAMNKINPSVTEAAELDGVTFFRELWSITLPSIFSTMGTFLIVGLVAIFSNDMGVYTLFATNAEPNIQTIGYYLTRFTISSSANEANWGYLSAFGLCCTIIVAPLTYLLRLFIEKVDPLS